MKETGSPKLLFEMLDLTPIQPILWKDLHQKGPGRPVKYNPEWDLRALMLRQLEQIPYVKDLVKRLRRNLYLRLICGYGEEVPTEAHFSQMKKRLGKAGFKAVECFLRHEAIRLMATQSSFGSWACPRIRGGRHRPPRVEQQRLTRHMQGPWRP